MKTIPWQPGFTWRKLGFVSRSSSLAYRDVLALNPSWDVTIEPPVGAVIYLEGTASSGQLEAIPTGPNGGSAQISQEVYPFDTFEDYTLALSKYSSGALMTVDRTNGFSMDSAQAVTGIQ